MNLSPRSPILATLLSNPTATKLRSSFVTIVVLALMIPALAFGQQVSAFGGASGPGLWSMSFNNLGTVAVANDDAIGASPNWISVNQKAYSSVNYIDMVFLVDDIGTPTIEYQLSEGVSNDTGIDWTDYHIELGFGVGAGFVPSAPGDGLDFDWPDLSSPYSFGPFGTVTVNEDAIDAVGGVLPAGAFVVMAFPIDVPAGISEFTVRQWPTIAPIPVEHGSWSQIKSLY